MVPLTRKPSFPPPAPPPSQCQHKRNFRLTSEDLQVLHLQPPANIFQPYSTMHTPAFLLERPSTPLPRTPSPSLSSEVDEDIIDQFPLPTRLRSLSENLLPESRGRPPPSPPPSIVASASASASASPSAYFSVPWTVYGATVATAANSRSSSPRPASHSGSSYVQPREPSPFLPPPTGQPSAHRSKFHPLAVFGLSKAARRSNPQLSEASARPESGEGRQPLWLERGLRAAQERGEIARQSLAQDKVKEIVQTRITALLQGRLPPGEDRMSTLSACARACERGGLDFSTVLQETSIEGHPPIYWAIINRDVTSGSRSLEPDSLVAAILTACRPLSPASLDDIRVACTMASDNVLLQELFRLIPPLLHISTRDALLLSPVNEEDRVDVEEKRNGTGSWVALIKIPRFRLRMRVCGSVSVEFIASGRMWILTFSAVTEALPGGRTENRWYLSLELEGQSPPTAVNATFLILGTPGATGDGYSDELARSIELCPPMSELSPGHDKGINIRVDDSPIGPYLLNESSLLVDSNKALHAKLTQTTVPTPITDTSSGSSYSGVEPQTPGSDIAYIPAYHYPPRPPNPPPPLLKFLPPADPRSSAGSPTPEKKKKKKKKRNEYHVSLRRGGR